MQLLDQGHRLRSEEAVRDMLGGREEELPFQVLCANDDDNWSLRQVDTQNVQWTIEQNGLDRAGPLICSTESLFPLPSS